MFFSMSWSIESISLDYYVEWPREKKDFLLFVLLFFFTTLRKNDSSCVVFCVVCCLGCLFSLFFWVDAKSLLCIFWPLVVQHRTHALWVNHSKKKTLKGLKVFHGRSFFIKSDEGEVLTAEKTPYTTHTRNSFFFFAKSKLSFSETEEKKHNYCRWRKWESLLRCCH